MATTTGSGDSRDNGLYVLHQNADKLEVAGSISGLGAGESIQSVRFEGDKAYVVTFPASDVYVYHRWREGIPCRSGKGH